MLLDNWEKWFKIKVVTSQLLGDLYDSWDADFTWGKCCFVNDRKVNEVKDYKWIAKNNWKNHRWN